MTALTKQQFDKIMSEIWLRHQFGGLSEGNWDPNKCKNIKYVRPSWDMRFGTCFSITFDPGNKTFRSEDGVPMYDRIMDWLNSPRVSKVNKREELMKRIKGYSMWPPKENIEQMTDEELERYINLVESAFKAAFEEDEK